MNLDSKIYVAGHRGLVGSAIIKNLESRGYTNIITRTHSELDLTSQNAVSTFFESEKPEYVFLAAAKVGGIVANNTYRGEFIYDNLMIQNNVIHQSYLHGVKKLMFLGSTCIYPKNAPQPMKEEYLLADALEYTNEPYAIAKIAGIKMCESYNLQYGTNFISVMPTNLYGPNDNFDLETSHVLPALLRKIHEAKLNDAPRVEIWGSGKPMREFLWSEDMADACVFLMEKRDFKDTISCCHPELHVPFRVDSGSSKQLDSVSKYGMTEIRNTHINIGSGVEISIHDLAYLIREIVGYNGELYFNSDKPDGTMRKLTDVSKLHALGWRHTVELKDGICTMYRWYKGEPLANFPLKSSKN
jgi:GDP-L-fucose synthase